MKTKKEAMMDICKAALPSESSQPKHTQGELQLGGVDYLDGFYEVLIHYADGTVFGNGTGKSPKEAEANAQRIVKAVNMHDELINAIKALLEDNTHLELNLDSVEKAEQLLKQAEKK